MKITAKDSEQQKFRDQSQDRHYVDITERAHNHFIRYGVIKSYDVNDLNTKTFVYSGTLHLPSEWNEDKLTDYLHDRHTRFCEADCHHVHILILQLYPLPSALPTEWQLDAKKVTRAKKLIEVLEAVEAPEDEFDRKMRKLIQELEGCSYE